MNSIFKTPSADKDVPNPIYKMKDPIGQCFKDRIEHGNGNIAAVIPAANKEQFYYILTVSKGSAPVIKKPAKVLKYAKPQLQ